MGSDDKAKGLPSTGILWLLLLGAGALFLRDAPWQGARPAVTDVRAYATSAQQDVDARLWQDPIGAVARAREEARKRGFTQAADPPASQAASDPHAAAKVSANVNERLCRGSDVLLMGVMVAGGPYPEWVEFRRRARYALLAGLHETGFVPEDEEHLGYVELSAAERAKERSEEQLPEFIAYEWMVEGEGMPVVVGEPAAQPVRTTAPARKQEVMVLWLDEDRVGKQMRTQVQKIAALLGRPCAAPLAENRPGRARFAVLGPSGTGPLKAMIAALASTASPPASAGADVPVAFYAYGATASDAQLLADAGSAAQGRTVHDFLQQRQVTLFRTIGSDDTLASRLVEELALRNIRPDRAMCPPEDPKLRRRAAAEAQHVVLIAERDSFYGRSLPHIMATKFRGAGDCASYPADRRKDVVHAYSYLRGLDGQLPAAQSDAASARKEEAGDAKTTGSAAAGEAARIERPEGLSQYDYLRRLSEQLVTLEEKLRIERHGSIGAIGVLGSDVYDKLLILQALRSQFPNAIVFTTDMDARLQHPQQLDWTHNAVVASSFGLSLDGHLQPDIAPFRDGYQTALFLSTMVAVHQARHVADHPGDGCDVVGRESEAECVGTGQAQIDRWLAAPRVFEIGRKSVFDFSRPVDAAARAMAGCSPRRLDLCADIQPEPTPMYPDPSSRWIKLALGLLFGVVALAGLFNGTWVRFVEWLATPPASGRRLGWPQFAALLAMGAGVGLFFHAYANGDQMWKDAAAWLTRDGEPIALLLGVSVWPTEVLRAVALVLSVWFICRGWRALDRNLDDISANLLWQPERRELMKQLHIENRQWSRLDRVVRMFSFRLGERSGGSINPKTGLLPSAERFWRKYMYQGRRSARLLRILCLTLAWLITGFITIQALGAPVAPVRGDLLVRLDPVLTMTSVIAMLVLIFFVVDATAFAYQLVSALRRRIPPKRGTDPAVAIAAAVDMRWPQHTLDVFAGRLKLEPQHLDQWITMHFVARRTDVVGRLVYYPFIVISLMIIARSPTFDNWNTTVGLAIVITGSVLIVVACATALRWAAERLRRSAIWHLSNEKIRLNGEGDEGRHTAAQLDVMIEQMRAFDSGAFAPYSRQPLVRALLLPLTSYGGAALVEYLSIANF